MAAPSDVPPAAVGVPKEDVVDKRAGGRPRNDAAGSTVLRAAYDILAEDGLGGLTIEAVAKRAGVGRPMIYRRWQNKGTLAVACFRATVMPDLTVARTDDPVMDLKRFMLRSIAVMDSPAGRIFGSIVAEAQRDAATLTALRDHYLTQRTKELAALIEDGQAQGLFSVDLDPETAIAIILGSVLHRLLLTDRKSGDFASNLIEMIYRSLGVSNTDPVTDRDADEKGMSRTASNGSPDSALSLDSTPNPVVPGAKKKTHNRLRDGHAASERPRPCGTGNGKYRS